MQALLIQEHIVFHIPASLYRESESVEGRMRVTNERILFDTLMEGSHSEHTAVAIEIWISELSGIYKRNTYLLWPSGIIVTLYRGDTYKFAVWKRDRLIGYLHRRIRALKREATSR